MLDLKRKRLRSSSPERTNSVKRRKIYASQVSYQLRSPFKNLIRWTKTSLSGFSWMVSSIPPYCVLSAEHLTIDPELKELELLWQRLWVTQEDPFEERDVLRDVNSAVDVEVTATFRVLYGLPRYGDVLVRKEYKKR